jgi:hypothetical protein
MYSVQQHNCYWYCKAILFILGKKFGSLQYLDGDGRQGRCTLVGGLFELELGNVAEDEKLQLVQQYERLVSQNKLLLLLLWINLSD